MQNKLGHKIAEGGCSEVYEWENGEKVVKLAKANTDIHAIRREFNSNRVARDLGLPVAQPYEQIDIEGRPGIVFERIDGEPLIERLMKQIFQNIQSSEILESNENQVDLRITAQILSQIHSHSDMTMPSQRDSLKYSINNAKHLADDEKSAIIHRLEQLPLKQQLCHGDPNPGNILIRDGKPVIIDWMDASIGNPEADLAEYIVMIRFGVLPPEIPSIALEFFDSMRESIIAIFLEEYMKLGDVTLEAVDSWILPIAARKLNADAVSDEEKQVLIQEIRRRLSSNDLSS
jgi:aminoglycoside phosphotransferase (APT) family kinase protein